MQIQMQILHSDHRLLRRSKTPSQDGFTVAELLIIAVVVGILIVLILVQFANVRARDRDTARKNDIRALQVQLGGYFAANGKFPTELSQIAKLPSDDCKAPNGKGTCQNPDYKYAAFKSGTTPSFKTDSDCDNTNVTCDGYVIYTNDMEAESNPYQVTN